MMSELTNNLLSQKYKQALDTSSRAKQGAKFFKATNRIRIGLKGHRDMLLKPRISNFEKSRNLPKTNTVKSYKTKY